MLNQFYLHFEHGLPKVTAQQKGETIKYKRTGQAYIQHYRSVRVQDFRDSLVLRMKKYAPKVPCDKPVKLLVWVCFDVKDKALWGKYKTTKPDCDNYVKEIKDVMTLLGFWKDDSQVVDLRVVKTFAEKGTIYVQLEDLNDARGVSV